MPSVPPIQYRENLIATIRTLRAKGSEPVLLVYPSILSDEATRAEVSSHWNHPRDLVDANIDSHPIYQAISREVAQSEDVRLVDLPLVFDSRGNEALHLDWVHPNDEGYELIAESLLEEARRALAQSRDEAG